MHVVIADALIHAGAEDARRAGSLFPLDLRGVARVVAKPLQVRDDFEAASG
jgi:hypothetical protein